MGNYSQLKVVLAILVEQQINVSLTFRSSQLSMFFRYFSVCREDYYSALYNIVRQIFTFFLNTGIDAIIKFEIFVQGFVQNWYIEL